LRDEAVREILSALKDHGFDFLSMLPEFDFAPLQEAASRDPSFMVVPCSSEVTAAAVCAGAWLGGKRPALLSGTSGLVVASWPLTSLSSLWGIPTLLVISYRGDLGDGFWIMKAYQQTTEPLLQMLQIPYVLVRSVGEIREAVDNATRSMEGWQHPVAILMSGEALA
jgi:sulfopyruvate decarboxylase TPP-binding subunit